MTGRRSYPHARKGAYGSNEYQPLLGCVVNRQHRFEEGRACGKPPVTNSLNKIPYSVIRMIVFRLYSADSFNTRPG